MQGYLRKGGVGAKLPPQGFRERACGNGEFDAMRSRFENMRTFSVIVVLQAYFIASQTLYPPLLCGGKFAPPLNFAGVTLHPLLLCGFNFAPTLSLRG